MKKNTPLERTVAFLVLISVGVVVGGTKACQEDYSVGGQTKLKDTATATATTTETADAESTETPTPTPTTTSIVTPIATFTSTPEVSIQAANSNGLYQQLSALGEHSAEKKAAAAIGAGAVGRVGADAGGNWLGRGFNSAKNGAGNGWIDSDGDGFSDSFEQQRATDALDSMDVPSGVATSKLNQRVRALDPDLDGLVTAEEVRIGTNPNSLDSDLDGRADGAEVLSDGDPLAPGDQYPDSDGDGISDSYERDNNMDPQRLDSDGDGLRDDLEVTVGSDARNPDSDSDGISDGKEFDLSSDPVLAEQ